MHKAGWVHSDVSVDNMLLHKRMVDGHENVHVILSDLEYAKNMKDPELQWPAVSDQSSRCEVDSLTMYSRRALRYSWPSR